MGSTKKHTLASLLSDAEYFVNNKSDVEILRCFSTHGAVWIWHVEIKAYRNRMLQADRPTFSAYSMNAITCSIARFAS